MASCSKRPRGVMTEGASEICNESDSDTISDIDSSTGGMSTGEEEELDRQLMGETSDSEIELR